MNIDFLMKEYFSSLENKKNRPVIKIKNSSWIIEEREIRKKFIFNKKYKLEYFILEILKYSRSSTCDISFIKSNNIVEVVITSLSPSISNIEIECSNDIDVIRNDVDYYKKND